MIVIGAPLYNFSLPSQLKAWIDRIAQLGRTFMYTDKGAVGLATSKTVIVASGHGGVYSTSEAARAMEPKKSYLQTVFGVLGSTDVRFVRAEGLAMGEAKKGETLTAAELEILALPVAPANQPEIALAACGLRYTHAARCWRTNAAYLSAQPCKKLFAGLSYIAGTVKQALFGMSKGLGLAQRGHIQIGQDVAPMLLRQRRANRSDLSACDTGGLAAPNAWALGS